MRTRSADPEGRPQGLLWRRPARIAFVAVLLVFGIFAQRATADAGTYTTIDGSGSSWAYIALSQWITDVAPEGLTINYNPDGSAEGRQDYMQGSQVDFAGSDPPFRNGDDHLAGTGAEVPKWGYSYVPDTAGGTAFMYHLTVGGKLVRNLRLNGQVLMEIFTGQITNWDNSAITKIYGAQLPNEPITPVLRSDGSGATYFFTLWMATEFPSEWNAFCEKVHPGITEPCGNTEFYPQFGDAKMENGSNNVADYITASYGEGSIGYDEYAYAQSSGYPVVQLLNPAGYFVGPTASNVAVALTKAQINFDSSSSNYLQQILTPLYTFKDPRNYPLSSYSYLIVPRSGTTEPPTFNTGAGASLSTFINYFLCAGQKQSASLGYSPLPLALVEGGLRQNGEIPGHVAIANVKSYSSCPNPTFTNGVLTVLKDAPQPSPCQKYGEPLNCTVENGKAVAGSGSGSSGSSGSGSKGSSGSNGGGGSTATGGSTTAAGTGPTTGAANVSASVVNIGDNGTDRALLAVLTALALIAAVATPPAVGSWLRRRKRQAGA
ncbi:MAG TPA: substrate-binding domain-containing protein [Streptosporangiaceae bacterium]